MLEGDSVLAADEGSAEPDTNNSFFLFLFFLCISLSLSPMKGQGNIKEKESEGNYSVLGEAGLLMVGGQSLFLCAPLLRLGNY